jgi:hypothetical protein
MNKLRWWYIRNFKILDNIHAYKCGLTPVRNIYGQEINYTGYRSEWKDEKGRIYAVANLVKELQ